MRDHKRNQGKFAIPVVIVLWLMTCYLAPRVFSKNVVGTLFGMAPPVLLLIPSSIGLLLLTIKLFRRKDVKPSFAWAIAILIASFPLVGFVNRSSADPASSKTVRVLTYNVHYKSREMPALLDYIKSKNIDVLFLQENSPGTGSPAQFLKKGLPGWHVAEANEVAILSRWSLTNVRTVPLKSSPGRSILIADVKRENPFQVMTVHWSLPQFTRGFQAITDGARRQQRDFEQTVSEAANANMPLIFGGDLNNPPGHYLTRQLSEEFTNCFDSSGSGVGWTFPSHRPWVRIDHLYINQGFKVVHTEVAPNLGSDHLPLFAEVEFVSSR